jgi:hypothetical protein
LIAFLVCLPRLPISKPHSSEFTRLTIRVLQHELAVLHGREHLRHLEHAAWTLLGVVRKDHSESKPNPHPIGASQPEVDLEAQLLNFLPMPDTLGIEFNPWSLP